MFPSERAKNFVAQREYLTTEAIPASIRAILEDENAPHRDFIGQFWFDYHKQPKYQAKPEAFWETLCKLTQHLSPERILFYHTYHRLGTLISWIPDSLSFEQVAEYDKLKTYEDTPNYQLLDPKTHLPIQCNDDRTVGMDDDLTVETASASVQTIQPIYEGEEEKRSPPFRRRARHGFLFSEANEADFMNTLPRILPYLLSNEAYQDEGTLPLTLQERARYDMDSFDPRYHPSRKMGVYSRRRLRPNLPIEAFDDDLTEAERKALAKEKGKDSCNVKWLIYMRHREEYLDEFFDYVILPLAEARARLYEEWAQIERQRRGEGRGLLYNKWAIFTSLEKQAKLLAEKIDVLSGCLKEQCREMKRFEIALANRKLHARVPERNGLHVDSEGFRHTTNLNNDIPVISVEPLQKYQTEKAPEGEPHYWCQDFSYRVGRAKEVNEHNIHDIVASLGDDTKTKPTARMVLGTSRNVVARTVKRIIGVILALPTLPLVILENLASLVTKHTPRLYNGFCDVFFRAKSQQPVFNGEVEAQTADYLNGYYRLWYTPRYRSDIEHLLCDPPASGMRESIVDTLYKASITPHLPASLWGRGRRSYLPACAEKTEFDRTLQAIVVEGERLRHQSAVERRRARIAAGGSYR